MATQVKKRHPALKHGAYSVTGLLPGESRAGFENLYLGLIAELHPDGPLEDEAVATITRLVWRKQNAATFSSSMGDEVNVHKMLANFEIEERLDGMIDRATVSSDLTVAPPFGSDASRESNRSPGLIG